MRYKVKLTKLKSNHNNLRTNEVDGYCHRLPILNQGFTMFAESLTGAGVRTIQTTKVLELDTLGNVITFRTRNSTYKVWYEKTKDETS